MELISDHICKPTWGYLYSVHSLILYENLNPNIEYSMDETILINPFISHFLNIIAGKD